MASPPDEFADRERKQREQELERLRRQEQRETERREHIIKDGFRIDARDEDREDIPKPKIKK